MSKFKFLDENGNWIPLSKENDIPSIVRKVLRAKEYITQNTVLSLLDNERTIYKLDLDELKNYVDNEAEKKLDKVNPIGSGTFSLNRKEGTTVGDYSFVEGGGLDTTTGDEQFNTASGVGSHAEGVGTIAGHRAAHAEGQLTEATGNSSHAEGVYTKATASNAHAEGALSQATGNAAHAEGNNTQAGQYAHSEGNQTKATGRISHAEGQSTEASGAASHAEGERSVASGVLSHAEGESTIAQGTMQHVQGRFNIPDAEDTYAHIVGNGTADNARSNAHTVGWDGTAWYSGDVYVGSTSGTNKDEGSKKLATEEYVNELVDSIIPVYTLNDAGGYTVTIGRAGD